MTAHPYHIQFELEPEDNELLSNLCGPFDENLRQVERHLGVEINNRGNEFHIIGDEAIASQARAVLETLYRDASANVIDKAIVHMCLQEHVASLDKAYDDFEQYSVKTRRSLIRARGLNQNRYLANLRNNDINFGIGPAGTGKTYLAVASAVEALESSKVRRLILVRPAVEAGEKLGFLPGDMAEKIDPYLRPLYDALYEMLGFEKVSRLIERNVIEVAPLAFMRGRTLNESFIILDEAQNTSVEQMKMFLTRIGFGSTAVVTGDVTQIDLPRGQLSGLRHVSDVLKNVEGISFTFFQSRDVVRHALVARILNAYEEAEKDERPVG